MANPIPFILKDNPAILGMLDGAATDVLRQGIMAGFEALAPVEEFETQYAEIVKDRIASAAREGFAGKLVKFTVPVTVQRLALEAHKLGLETLQLTVVPAEGETAAHAVLTLAPKGRAVKTGGFSAFGLSFTRDAKGKLPSDAYSQSIDAALKTKEHARAARLYKSAQSGVRDLYRKNSWVLATTGELPSAKTRWAGWALLKNLARDAKGADKTALLALKKSFKWDN
jgi:hypothetical protein